MLRSNEIIRAAALNASSKVGVGVYEDGGVVENSNTTNTNVAAGSAAISNSLDLFASYIQAKETSVSAREKNLRSNSSYSRSAELNSYYRSKLRRSLTYLITQGYFQTVRSLIQSKTADLNETDQWWLLNPNVELVNKKCLLVRRDRYRILSRLQSSIDSLNRFGSPQLGIALGRTPLMLCSMIQDDSWAFSIAQMLFENGAQLDMKDTLGYSALMYACLYERARIMELFLNASGTEFDIFDKDNYGNTVFHLASMHPSENMCCICDTIATKFGFKKESLKLRNYFRHTPMDLCFLNGHQTCIKRYYELLESPKSPTRIFDNSQGPKLSSRSASTFLLSPSILLNSNSTSNNNKKQSLKDISSSSNENQFKNNQLKQLDVLNVIDKKRVLETYKIVLCLREPLIKVNDKRKKKKQQSLITTSAPTRNEYIRSGKTKSPIIITRFQRLSIFKPYDEQNGSNSSTRTMPIIRQPQRRGTFEMRRQDEDTMLASSLNLTNLTKTNASGGGDFGSFEWSTISWRNNVEKLFETVEFQRTKSYRTPSSGSTNNLFEQLLSSSANGAIVVDAATAASQQQAAAGADRKGSMAKAKLTIAQNNKDSSNTLQPTSKTSGSTNKSITGGSQKRASVISLKNI